MIEKVNPSHPDKVADRIAGAIVDLAYKKQDNPKIAVEVLIGHGTANIIIESSVGFDWIEEIEPIVKRIAGGEDSDAPSITGIIVPQDKHLAANQAEKIKCGDNGIFKGVPINSEENHLTQVVRSIYEEVPFDGKYIWDEETRTFIACQSHTDDATEGMIRALAEDVLEADRIILNPLGRWTGGTNVDTGATNRKLGSDMGRAVTGGGLHGKDLSKADVSINIWCHLMAQQNKVPVEALCAIGDEQFIARMDGEDHKVDYAEAVALATEYIKGIGGFEELAKWGLI